MPIRARAAQIGHDHGDVRVFLDVRDRQIRQKLAVGRHAGDRVGRGERPDQLALFVLKLVDVAGAEQSGQDDVVGRPREFDANVGQICRIEDPFAVAAEDDRKRLVS